MTISQSVSRVCATFIVLNAVGSIAAAGPLTSHRGINLGGLAPADVRYAHSIGSDIVRMQVFLDGKVPGLEGLKTVQSWFPILDPAVAVASSLGMTAVIDLHHPRLDDKTGEVDRKKFIADWRELSRHFKSAGSANKVWYDLWNEPPRGAKTRELLTDAAQAIRENRDNHPLIVPHFGSVVSGVEKSWEPLKGVKGPQILGVHFWDWPSVLLADADYKGPPRNYGEPGQDRAELVRLLDLVGKTARSYDVPVFIGEMGMIEDRRAGAFFSDFFRAIDRRHPDFSIAIHAWNNWAYTNNDAWPAIHSFLTRTPQAKYDSAFVPEPSSVVLLTVAMTWLVRRDKQTANL